MEILNDYLIRKFKHDQLTTEFFSKDRRGALMFT